MNTLLRKAIIYGIFFLIGLLSFKVINGYTQKKEFEERRNTFPTATINNMDGYAVNVEKEKSILAIYFHPQCDYCMEEMGYIKENMDILKNTNILLFSIGTEEDTYNLLDANSLREYSNVHAIKDEDDFFYKNFGTRSIPSIFIYGRDHQLVKFYKGETKIDAILKHIK